MANTKVPHKKKMLLRVQRFVPLEGHESTLFDTRNSFRPIESKLQRNSYNNFERIVKPSAFSEFFRTSEIATPIRILGVAVLLKFGFQPNGC